MLQGDVNVCKSLAVGVMAVHSESLCRDLVDDVLEEKAHAPCGAGADRVGQANLLASGQVQAFCHFRHRLWCDWALKWAAERAADVATHANATFDRGTSDFLGSIDSF
eukprot:scaffold144712_cov30-Tisochrysis_lutea.AAC.1